MNIAGWHKVVLVLGAMGLLTGFGFGDMAKQLPGGSDECSKSDNPKKCRKKEEGKAAVKIVATGLAAKLISDMVIQYSSLQTSAEGQVEKEYKLTHKSLPAEPLVVEYSSSIKPGQVVNAGKEVLVGSKLVVVSGTNAKVTDIQEQIAIYDNEKNDQQLISLTKPVNDKTKKSGAFENEFKFTLPVGMPQGVYPVRTLVLVNGKEMKPTNNSMQLVLNVDNTQHYQIIALNP